MEEKNLDKEARRFYARLKDELDPGGHYPVEKSSDLENLLLQMMGRGMDEETRELAQHIYRLWERRVRQANGERVEHVDEFLSTKLRAELKPIDTLPQWAKEHSFRWHFAPRTLRRYLRKAGIWPSWYAAKMSRDDLAGRPVVPYVDYYVVWGKRLGWLTVFPDEIAAGEAM